MFCRFRVLVLQLVTVLEVVWHLHVVYTYSNADMVTQIGMSIFPFTDFDGTCNMQISNFINFDMCIFSISYVAGD